MGSGFNVKSLNLGHYSHGTPAIFLGSALFMSRCFYYYYTFALLQCACHARLPILYKRSWLTRSLRLYCTHSRHGEWLRAATPLPLLLIRGMQFNILHDSHSDAGFRTICFYFSKSHCSTKQKPFFSLFCIKMERFDEVTYSEIDYYWKQLMSLKHDLI